ncbi:WxL protein peptidoglycan domain-containing protein, partial [Bacillus cereus]|uniref:WxL protein peptidoglycan domain-containing protein n=1 Tax=Bacillus cereus TaxID=1396 RepID=UPI000B4BD13E
MKKFLLSMLIILGISQINVLAEEGNFSVRPLLPIDQLDSKVPYYYFPIKGGEVRVLEFVIKNHKNENAIIEVNSANALSNPYGNMHYTEKDTTTFSSFLIDEYKLAEITEINKRIKLGPNQEKVVSFKVKAPKNVNRGQLLGAIQFQLDVTSMKKKTAASDNNAAFSVQVKHRYTIGILANFPEKAPSKVEIKSSKVDANNQIPQIMTEIWNVNPVITKDLTLKYKVYSKSKKKEIFRGEKLLYSLAPVTSLKLPVEWKYKDFKEGDYIIELSLINNKNDQLITSKENKFTVEKKDINEYADHTNQDDSFIPKAVKDSKWFNIGMGIGLSILFIVGYVIGRYVSKKQKI